MTAVLVVAVFSLAGPTTGVGVALGQEPVGTAIVRGQVADSNGVPIAGAELRVLGTPLRASTDDRGLFRFTGVPVGKRVVTVSAIGWRPLTFELELQPEQEWIGRIGLEPAPVVLPELRATAKDPADWSRHGRLSDFEFRRRHPLGGVFRDRAQIERMHALATGELLKGIPSVRVSFPFGDAVTVAFARCTKDHVGVWIDGNRVRAPDPSLALNLVNPADIEAMEVYRGPSELPAEFLDNTCAAIVIWTK